MHQRRLCHRVGGASTEVTMLGMWLGHETSWNHSQGVLLVVPNAATICSCTYSSCWRLPLYTDVILSYSSFWMISVRLKFNLPFHHFQQNFTNVLSWQRTWRLYTLHPAPGFEAGKFLVCHQREDWKAWTLDDWNGRIQQQWVSCCIPRPVPDMKSFTFDAVRCSLFPGPFLRSSTLVWPMSSNQMWCAAVVLGTHLSFQLVTGFITISHSFWSMANYDHFFKFITVSIYLQYIYIYNYLHSSFRSSWPSMHLQTDVPAHDYQSWYAFLRSASGVHGTRGSVASCWNCWIMSVPGHHCAWESLRDWEFLGIQRQESHSMVASRRFWKANMTSQLICGVVASSCALRFFGLCGFVEDCHCFISYSYLVNSFISL